MECKRQKVWVLTLKMISATNLIRCGVANPQNTSFFILFACFEKSVIFQKNTKNSKSHEIAFCSNI